MMFLLKPFIWMLKVAEFKEHIKFLALYVLISAVVALGCIFLLSTFAPEGILGIVCLIITIFSVIQVPLFLSGYFWNLTQNVISRELEIVASNIYDNKIGTVDKIKLPEINVLNMIWRGFASIVATVLMIIPFALLLILISAPAIFVYSGNPMTSGTAPIIVIILSIFICPALLWNYARRNSVVAVWNLPKAIYIMGNYPFRYIGKILLIGAIYIVLSVVSSAIAAVFSFCSLESIREIENIVPFIIYGTITEIISLYFIYVYAYLIGTIAPPEEA